MCCSRLLPSCSSRSIAGQLTWLLAISALRADTLKAVPFSHPHDRQCSFRVVDAAINSPASPSPAHHHQSTQIRGPDAGNNALFALKRRGLLLSGISWCVQHHAVCHISPSVALQTLQVPQNASPGRLSSAPAGLAGAEQAAQLGQRGRTGRQRTKLPIQPPRDRDERRGGGAVETARSVL